MMTVEERLKEKCSECNGTGEVTETERRFTGLVSCVPVFVPQEIEVTCPKCNGTGKNT